jgi:hypothetical protein
MPRTKKEKPVDYRVAKNALETIRSRLNSAARSYCNTIKPPLPIPQGLEYTMESRAVGSYIERFFLHGETKAFVQSAASMLQAAEATAYATTQPVIAADSWYTTMRDSLYKLVSIPVEMSYGDKTLHVVFRCQSLMPLPRHSTAAENQYNFFGHTHDSTHRSTWDARMGIYGVSDLPCFRPRFETEFTHDLPEKWIEWAERRTAAERAAYNARDFTIRLIESSETMYAASRAFIGLRTILEALQVGHEILQACATQSRGKLVDKVDIGTLRRTRPNWIAEWEKHRETLLAAATAHRLHGGEATYIQHAFLIEENSND